MFAERQALRNVGTVCNDEMVALMEEKDGQTSVSDLFDEENGAEVDRLLRIAMTNSPDMTAYVTDANGAYLFSTGKYADEDAGQGDPLLGESARAEAGNEGAFLDNEQYGTPANVLTYVTPIVTESGETVGYLLITSTAEARSVLMDATLRSAAVAGLWILILAFVAIYFTTQRIIRPLREISRAAKKLMVGRFDVRVRVRGRDEVAELAAAFNQMATSLENLDRMRSSFVANVSHDLRTPMTTVLGFIDGILDGVIPPEEQEYYLRVISDEVRRLSRLVTALLDVSRMQAGERKLNETSFDVCEMGRRILASFEQKIEERGLSVECACEEPCMQVFADSDAVYQVLYNICDNAVKFARDGGKVRMSFAYTAERKVAVTVYNEGEGIPEEDRPFIFERFYKGDKSRGLDKSGAGLGMFIAKTIVEAHGESISVSGEYGRDCAFTFTLPRV